MTDDLRKARGGVMSDDELLAAELDAIRSALEAARAQLINLNDAIDDFWNDPTRPSVVTMRSGTVSNLSIAQLDARASLAKIDAALASLDAPQTDALREAENAVSHAFGLLSSAVRCGEAWRQELDDAKDRARAALARLKGEGESDQPKGGDANATAVGTASGPNQPHATSPGVTAGASIDTGALRELLAKATPGPWTGKETDPNDFHELIEITAASRAGKVPICKIEVGFTGPIEDEQRANGRLIAAAPTMAEALKALLDQLDAVHADPRYRSVWEVSQLHVGPYNGPTYTAEYEAARAALARLKGEGAKPAIDTGARRELLARAIEALEALLACPEIADCDPRDKDPETHVAERKARAALARLKGEGAKPAPDVEKVAGALFRAQMISTRSWEETDEDIRESYRVNARAAIAAMEG